MKISPTIGSPRQRVTKRPQGGSSFPLDSFVRAESQTSPEQLLAQAGRSFQLTSAAPADDLEEQTSAFPGRNGYQDDFLGRSLPLPKPGASHRGKIAMRLDDPGNPELTYRNFSVVMHKERRQALFTAVNIDGSSLKSPSRDGLEWTIDTRIPRDQQLGNEAYRHNPIDRGHLVKRLDPVWGEHSDQANADSFAYTNSGLQHAMLNQREWAKLENHVLRHADAHDQKMTVMTGPVFQDSDRRFDNKGKMETPVQVPEAFWKMAVWNDPDEGLKAVAFVLSQKDLLDQSGIFKTDLEPGRFRIYQVPIDDLSRLTDLDFGDLNSVNKSVQVV